MSESILRAVPFTVRVKSYDIPFVKGDDGIYKNEALGLSVKVELTRYEGTAAVRQINTITNNSDKEVLLTGFSSAAIMTSHGTVALSMNRWQCEGQWQYLTDEDCGLIPASVHPWERNFYRIDSVGSWASGHRFPLTMKLGDDGYAYFMEIEGGHNWMLEHIISGGMHNPVYSLEGSAAHEENGGWFYHLKPGESYSTRPAVWGRIRGGFEEAAQELCAYRRADSLVKHPDGVIPVVFNDYMNCLWGEPNRERLIPLIDAAAKVGCEYFCIDAGWHKNALSAGARAGDWIVDNDKFGEGGLQGIFDYMKSKGLIPGVWFEWETVNSNAASYTLDEDCLLKRYDSVIPRAFFNFRNEKVRAHLSSRVDELYHMGVRYIKNDYNATTGIGCDDPAGNAPAQGLIDNFNAFVSWVDEVIAAHPGLIIENCGSGACRSEHGTLKHFWLQSTSDQEFYYLNPSIIAGTMAQMEPEKAGIWAYPMAVGYDERQGIVFDEAWQSRHADGEATIFNMVNGMCGVLYQSGRLDHADEKNLALVAEGIAAYKKMRADIVNAHPILPCGTHRLEWRGITAAGLENADKSRAYLAVWRIGGTDSEAKIDVSKYGYTKATVWYPEGKTCELKDGILSLALPAEYCARMILLEK